MPPTTEHEVLGDLFRRHPAFAAELLRDLVGLRLPEFDEVRRESVDFTNIKPAPYFADAAVVLTRKLLEGERIPRQQRRRGLKQDAEPPESIATLGVVVEIQRDDDPDKQYSWPVYVSTFAALLRCPVVLLVICTSDRIAQWAAEPIRVGEPEFTLRPLVLGPSAIPKIIDPDFAREHPQLTVLSARVKGDVADADLVLRALAAALANVDPDDARLYYHVVLDGLKPSARDLLKKELRTVTAVMRDDPRAAKLQQLVEGALAEGKAEGKAEGMAEGKAEGMAEGEAHGRVVALLEVLAARRIDVPDEIRQRIATCTDLDQLATWIRRSVTVSTVKELFE
jgi:hypothetical protein